MHATIAAPFEASAGLVHIVLWVSAALTVISAAVNIRRSIKIWDNPVAPLFLVRGILSLGYTTVYASRLTQPVREISDPTSLFAFTMGVISWILVWILPAAILQPTPTPSQVLDGQPKGDTS
jgi:hypothetical protein